jgi:hypothetical protein
VKDEYGFDIMALVVAQMFLYRIGWNTNSVGNFEHLDLDPMGASRFAETSAEVAIDATEHPIAGRESVDHARFPSACARPWVQDDLSLGGLEDAFEALKDLLKYAGEFRAPMIDEGLRHGADNPLGD